MIIPAFIVIIMTGLVSLPTASPAFSIVDPSTTDDNLTEQHQQEQEKILPIPNPTHADAEIIVMAIKMVLELEPGSDMQEYSLLRIQEILEDNFTFAEGYTVHINYANDTRTEAETKEDEDTRMLAKTLSIQISNQRSGGS
jgi:hypothetical protein